MNKLTKILGLSALMLGSLAANAAPISWNFSYSGTGVSANGVLTTDDTLSSGAYLITNIAGQRNGESILSLVPAGTFGSLFSNNLLFASGPFLDNSGVTYLTASGAYNFCYAGGGCGASGYQDIQGTPVIFTPVQLTVARAVPEPSMIAMFGLGLILLGVVKRKGANR